MYEQFDRFALGLIERSTPERTAWNIEKIRQGKPADWNYIDGCMITALLSLAEITGEARYFDFSERFIDAFVNEDGTIRTYDPENARWTTSTRAACCSICTTRRARRNTGGPRTT